MHRAENDTKGGLRNKRMRRRQQQATTKQESQRDKSRIEDLGAKPGHPNAFQQIFTQESTFVRRRGTIYSTLSRMKGRGVHILTKI
jgi:hypothetical protein